MKPAPSRLRRLLLVLVVLAGGFLTWSKDGGPRATETSPTAAAAASPGRSASAPTEPVKNGKRGLDLSRVEATEHRTQIERVVEAMDRTGAPPEGVAQGGRRGGQKGVFQNAEGALPRKAPGYWIESDVWPKNGPRDAERLIFGRGDEVYWTRDHYKTFVQLR